MKPIVYIVFCMDTEGPCADSGRPELLDSWERVDGAVDKLFDRGFRTAVPDSSGGSLTIGWFFLTWTGFTSNPRGRALGYHAVRDHYIARWREAIRAYGDEHCWHYHHPPASGIANEWNADWQTNREYAAIISRQIAERDWFPSCYRAGGTIMSGASSRWIDRWFPIDYSNRAPVRVPGVMDWSRGQARWDVYHPDPEDFLRPGSGGRRMARCLDLVTGAHTLSESDIADAFDLAWQKGSAVLSVFDHDYRDIAARVTDFRRAVASVASRYAGVQWQYATPTEAVRRHAQLPQSSSLSIDAAAGANGSSIEIRTSMPVFQRAPWVCVRDRSGRIVPVEDGVVRLGPTCWRWTPALGLDWQQAWFACSTDTGASAIANVAAKTVDAIAPRADRDARALSRAAEA